MELLISLNGQTAGRDKLARVIQYFSRIVWDTIRENEDNVICIERFKSLEYNLSSFRKLLRLGKCTDVLYTALHSVHCQDPIVRVTLTLSKISQALFLLADHMVWFARSGLFNRIDVIAWTRSANKYWLLSIVMNLVRDFHEIRRLLKGRTISPQLFRTTELVCLMSQLRVHTQFIVHKQIAIDTFKNLCDLFIPLNALGVTHFSARTIGVLGVLSSLAGLIPLVTADTKLLPA